MNLFDFFFRNDKVQCPRCLGKGQVDAEDIKRLGNELYWRTGLCAYCQGEGRISSKKLPFVDAADPYLSIDLPKRERRRLFCGDKKAAERAKTYKSNIDNLVQEIVDLYFNENREPDQIARTLSYRYGWALEDEKERQQIIDFIKKVVAVTISKK